MKNIRVQQWLEEYINKPIKVLTYEEATANLQKLGILDDEGNITPKYKDILVKK